MKMDEDWEVEIERRKAEQRLLDRQWPRRLDSEPREPPFVVNRHAIVLGLVLALLCAGGIWNTFRNATHQNRQQAAPAYVTDQPTPSAER